ncbi:MAG: VWA domain-containing protein [Bryobacterales bacterium]|nr:VWA domain-containing protein [Bryobacterales bacterium]
MHLLNFSLAEFLTLFTASSAVVVALYLLDRSRRRVRVAALRFWTQSSRPVESEQRRRIRQWPSLLLQLLSIAALLLAASQLRWGSRETGARDHVLLLDTSAWSAARTAGQGGTETLLDRSKSMALAYVRALPAADRVMVAYADGLATPVTAFESDRRRTVEALRRAAPGESALNLAQALEFARGALRRHARSAGEIVLAGGNRIMTGETSLPSQWPANLRLLLPTGNPENVGIRKIGLRPSPEEAGLWRILVSVRNYGARPHTAELTLLFGGAPAGGRTLQLAPGQEVETAMEYRTRAAGLLEARVRAAGDRFRGDDRAVLELPSQPELAVTVCSDEPELLRPLLSSLPVLAVTTRSRAHCEAAPPEGVAIYDRAAPAAGFRGPSLLLEPPPGRSPVPVVKSGVSERIDRWEQGHPLAAGLRAQDFRLTGAKVFQPGAGDTAIAFAPSGPVLVAHERAGQPKVVVAGFHPLRSQLKFALATPLLFANVLRWLSPQTFQRTEVYAGTVGAVTAPVREDGEDPSVVDESGAALPYTVRGGQLRTYSAHTGAVRVIQNGREQTYSLALPEVPGSVWTPPEQARRGVPAQVAGLAQARDLWPWLAALGALGLMLDWILFAPSGSGRFGSLWRWPLPRSLAGRAQ